MMEAAKASETSVNFYQTTRPDSPEAAIFDIKMAFRDMGCQERWWMDRDQWRRGLPY
jgi:hypothetical protein